jgi:Big-like domain-containing protein
MPDRPLFERIETIILRVRDYEAAADWYAASPGGIENLGGPANWLANVIQAMPTQVVPLGGGDQVTTPGSTLPIPLIALVEDSFGSPIPGVTVSWSASSAGTVSPASTITDAVGEATASWTVGPASGSQTATATATPGGFSATFTATVL